MANYGIRNRIPEIGEQFHGWTVINNEPIKLPNKEHGITCRCKCGTEAVIRIGKLLNGKTTGCRCVVDEARAAKITYIGNISDSFWGRCKLGAKRREIEFSITKEYAWSLLEQQQHKCALSGIPILLERSLTGGKRVGKSNITASIDRIDSSQGYIEGNIQWLHKDVNNMKQAFTQEYFVQLCSEIAKQA